VLLGDSFIVVMHQQPIMLLVAMVLSAGEILLKPRYQLFKRLFVHSIARQCRVEVYFIYALGEKSRVSPR
jgi:hypothetical protein